MTKEEFENRLVDAQDKLLITTTFIGGTTLIGGISRFTRSCCLVLDGTFPSSDVEGKQVNKALEDFNLIVNDRSYWFSDPWMSTIEIQCQRFMLLEFWGQYVISEKLYEGF